MLLILGLCLGLPLCGGQQDPLALAEELEEALRWDDQQIGLRVPRQVRLQQRLKTKPLMTHFSVKSTIISRYAFTMVSCSLLNRASEDKEVEFQMQIPAAAFITNFTMVVGDKVYQGEVAEKEKIHGDRAKKQNNKTLEENGEKETETFSASVIIPAKNKAAFFLHYEELLQRRLGKYEHVISVRPQQLSGRLHVEVNILEKSGIVSLEVPQLQNSRQKGSGKVEDDVGPPPSTEINKNETFAKIIFNPSIIQQAKIAQNGILGDFIIRYDVNREQRAGDIQVLNDYFVHYFAPKDLPPLPKNVVFVLDSSASMVGTKLRQTKDALFTILHDLRPQDHFNIVGFSNRIKVWQDRLVSVTLNNIRDSKVYIHHMTPTGGTDIDGALQKGIELLNGHIADNDIDARSVSLIVFLTDGKATVGETQSSKILSNTKKAAQGRVCIFTIGIGNDVDFKLLEKLSLENCGMTRRVQEEDNAKEQLIGINIVYRYKTESGPDFKKQYSPRIKISRTSADGDPHFVVDFPLSKLTVCFNIDGNPGDILRLVSDHMDSGVTVNGELIGAPAPPNGHKKYRTYFRTITILINKPERSYLEITPNRIVLDGGDRLVLPCNQSVVVGSRGLELSVSANANITVTIQGTITFVILIHLYKNPAPYQRNHLGFYISNSKGLSANCHGLLGQFLNQDPKLTKEPVGLGSNRNHTEPSVSQADLSSETILKVKGHRVPVVWKQRKIYNGQEQIDCWFARNSAKLIDGVYKNYLASHPFDTETTFGVGASQ
ncbi:inter-alpha-trypsin inhibitor heavy chain H5 [Gracilinanus agilis]|uniref:inter-alpha-trypsin inhibitor heavy chain H5 n=1 Tax=Gracilinanus agilis TaxID=191870 RepID=UPI001CFC5A63|nr:inter-alpha-trypsin inhibitor heavy chain H5 [Gracilinanus agilis]